MIGPVVGEDGNARAGRPGRDDLDGDEQARTGAGAEGIEHLRAAAGELIAACRAMLDAAEELLEDPATVSAVADGFGALLRGAADLGRRAAGARVGRHDGARDGGGDGRDGAEPSRVQRIRVVE